MAVERVDILPTETLLSRSEKWAEELRRGNEKLRSVSPEIPVDIPTLVLGNTLSAIIGDDANCFGRIDQKYSSEELAAIRKMIILRLEIEAETPELPENIRQYCRRVQKHIQGLDMTTNEGYLKAFCSWDSAKYSIREVIMQDPKLQQAIRYYLAYDNFVIQSGKLLK